MRLFFMPDDHIYGQWDMHESLESQYWHYYWDAGVQYPSCAGLSAKYVGTLKIYSTPASDWTLELDGRQIGGVNFTVSRTYFEQALACQFGSNHSVNFTDSQGRNWGGMPLWFLCGFVDDADQHSNNAYNESKAIAGYRITVTGSDGANYTFDSRDTIRSSNYIVANTLNGTPIPEGDSSWPLRLVGQNATGSKSVKKIASITLEPSLVDKIGVYQGGAWYLDMNGNGAWGPEDAAYGFGAPGWTQVVGDWDGDGSSEIGVYQGGAWYLDMNGNGAWGPEDAAYGFGATEWIPVIL
jgi:DMSO/TMAO reductase YedYZ molybdopterin-dependent catalytic subunit